MLFLPDHAEGGGAGLSAWLGACRLSRLGRAAGWGALLAVLFAAACGGGDAAPAAHLRAVASLELFADMVRNVGGDRVDVMTLLPSGADPHTYEPSPGRVADIARADVVFVNGLGLEGNVLDVIGESASGAVVELTEGLDTIDENPHLWLDVTNAARYAERIRDALIRLDPDGRDEYEANAEAYLEKLGTLDREIEEAIQAIPRERRKLVTFHAAFAYLARRYGLEVVAVVVPSPGQEPSARDVAELIELLRPEDAPAVFKEPQFNNGVLEQAAEDAGVPVFELLSDSYTEGVSSYIELMRFNLRQLQEALRGG